MPSIEIIRLEEDDQGTFGVLKINKVVFCVTLEPQDRLNAPNVSCIPAQQYYCTSYSSPNFGKTFSVNNVPERDLICFHPGNTSIDTKGCILLAEHFGKLQGDRAVLNSGRTFRRFMEIMRGYTIFHLTIKECY
jgi:hypothetical protein